MTEYSKSKVAIFYLIIIVLFWVSVEFIAYAFIGIRDGKLFSWSEHQSSRAELVAEYQAELDKELKYNKKTLAKSEKVRIRRGEEVIHPYLGYVMEHRDTRCPDLGFCDDRNRNRLSGELVKKKDNQVVVAIFGGSFAYGVSNSSTPGLLEQELAALPEYSGKEIVVHTFSLGGYKQPQQLMALNYHLLKGFEFDLVINIDGFNEIVLPIVDGINRGTNPAFPRGWASRLRGSYNKELLVLYGNQELIKKKRVKMAETMDSSILKYSVIANAIWRSRDERQVKNISDIQTRLVTYSSSKLFRTRYAARGPDYLVESREQLFRDLATAWAKSSQLMFALAKANNIGYFHFLQPNQYVAGTKPMSVEEQEIAILENHPYRREAIDGYPFLIDAGNELRDSGVPYFDLTQLFKDNDEVLYFDACCHLNQKGYDYIIREIVETVGRK
jgi:hypothetical protein